LGSFLYSKVTMVIFSGIVVLLQIWLLIMALFYVRQKHAIHPEKGYQLWKQQAFFSLIPLGIASFTFAKIRSLPLPLFMLLSIETLALSLLVISLFYMRPRYLADKAVPGLGVWKLITIFSIALVLIGPFIPIVLMV
jgi:hypothetical protein